LTQSHHPDSYEPLCPQCEDALHHGDVYVLIGQVDAVDTDTTVAVHLRCLPAFMDGAFVSTRPTEEPVAEDIRPENYDEVEAVVDLLFNDYPHLKTVGDVRRASITRIKEMRDG
jgi:hypothetical protein